MENLAKRLIQAREEKGWSKADLKRAAKLKSPSTLTEIESGKRTESPQLPIIAAALGVEVLWLQHGTGPKTRAANNVVVKLPKKIDPDIAEVVRLMEATDERGRIMVLMAARNELKHYKPAKAKRS